ncbi:MAG: hypothetical protein FWF15_07355 [Oscillospiraceae bacterium]|nr:hypothetical protein [Oscillospiraceae bacterium]
MKKLLLAVILSIIVCIMAMPANAMADIIGSTTTMTLDLPAVYANVTPIEIETFVDAAGQTTSTIEPFTYVYMKPYDVDFPYIYIPFSAPSDGIYDFCIAVMSNAGDIPRTGLAQIDDSAKVYMYTLHGERGQIPEYFVGISAALSAGDHMLRLYLGEDFDDTAIKSLFFDKFYFVKTSDLPVEVIEESITEEAVAETPAETSPVTQPPTTAPATADYSVLFGLIMIAANGFAAKIKKR